MHGKFKITNIKFENISSKHLLFEVMYVFVILRCKNMSLIVRYSNITVDIASANMIWKKKQVIALNGTNRIKMH